MNIADRIQRMRKEKGLSQEELAGKIGVSRQAVSKWELSQSEPELDKIIILSEFFGVTTDYILKGVESPASAGSDKSTASKILYVGSVALILIGLLTAMGGWSSSQNPDAIFGSMIIQAVGALEYFIARIISNAKAPFPVKWLDIMLLLWIPLSVGAGMLLRLFSLYGYASPYPVGIFHWAVFIILYVAAGAVSFKLLSRKNK